ncbi:hypothetical protein OAK69_00595 [bacterium]|nr:hypothetical protein [bacterium]
MITLIKKLLRFIKLSIITIVVLFAFGFALKFYLENKETVDAALPAEVSAVDVEGSLPAKEIGMGLAVIGMIVAGLLILKNIFSGLFSGGGGGGRNRSPKAAPTAAPTATPTAAAAKPKPAPTAVDKPKPAPKQQHGYKLTYQNITAKKGNTQTVQFLFRGGPTECRIALESGELSGQGFIPSCCQIVSLEMIH